MIDFAPPEVRVQRIIGVTGVAGAGMAAFGAILAMFMGSAGVFSGADDAGGQVGRGFAALGIAGIGLAGAVVVRLPRWVRVVLLVGSAAGGTALLPEHFALGAVLLVACAAVTLRLGDARTNQAG